VPTSTVAGSRSSSTTAGASRPASRFATSWTRPPGSDRTASRRGVAVSYELIVRGGTVVTATGAFPADLGVDAGRIAAIAPLLPPGRLEIGATGLLVLPGGVDVHTHLDAEVAGVRSADDFESGTAAAACGGITTICDYAWPARGQSLQGGVEAWRSKAAGRAHIDYGFHVIVSEASDATLAEIPKLVDLGYPSLKVFMINEFGIGDEAILRVL